MTKSLTRLPRDDETPSLRNIWTEVFGGCDDGVFFDHFYDRDMCRVIFHHGIPAAAGYFMPAGNILCGDLTVPCAMIYAVATLPPYRNRGYGAEIVRQLIAAGNEAGYPAMVLCPSSDDLFNYYSKNTVLQEFFYTSEHCLKISEAFNDSADITEITAQDYYDLRENLLTGTPHIEMTLSALEYQSLLCNLYGGGLFKITTSAGLACAVVEKALDGNIWIKELLTKNDCLHDVTASIASLYPAPEYFIRSPAQNHGQIVRRFGMLAVHSELFNTLNANNAPPWYGLAFD